MDGLKIMILFILFLLAADLFMLRPVRKTKQDERREAYQARVKEERAKRKREAENTKLKQK